MSRQRTPESCVLKAITDLLAAERIWFERRNTGAVKVEDRFVRYGSSGTADLMATPEILFAHPNCAAIFKLPCVLWIEAKAPKGKQSALQALFEKDVTARGHFYLLAKGSDDVLAWLKLRRSTPWDGSRQ